MPDTTANVPCLQKGHLVMSVPVFSSIISLTVLVKTTLPEDSSPKNPTPKGPELD